MQFIYEIFPVFLFFIVFKLYDIYAATVVGIVATLVQVIAGRLWTEQWDKKQLITLLIFVLFGGMTLYFHNPVFVKWKPTVVFWLFALTIVITHVFTPKPLMQRMMENMIQEKGTVPQKVWNRLSFVWALFFVAMGAVNLYVAYHFSNDAWVNFKFYGITSALVVLSVFQALYLTRYLSEAKTGHEK